MSRPPRAPGPSKTRLLVVGPTPPPYFGVAVSTSLILQSPAVEQRFSIEHLDTSDRRADPNFGAWDVENMRLAMLHLWRVVRRAARGRGVLYLTLSENWPAFLRDALFILVATTFRWRVAVHVRNSAFGRFYRSLGFVRRAFVRMTLRRVSGFAVLGESILAVFEGIVPMDRFAVVPNGTPDIPRNGLNPDPMQILFLSNLLRKKGVLEACRAAVLVCERVPEARFVFVGRWQDAELEREARAIALPFGDRIRFMPPVVGDEKRRLLLESSILLFPPAEPEGHPRVLLEGMAAGLAIVTTDRGAIRDTVTEGESAIVLRDPVPEQLADAVVRFLTDRTFRDLIARNARKRYEEDFRQEHTDAKLTDWLSRIAA